jgi:predicted transcriptional regulator
MNHLHFPSWFYVLDVLYMHTSLFIGVNLSERVSFTDVYKDLKCKNLIRSYAYIHKSIKFLEENNYLYIEKKGRYSRIELTKRGIRLGESVHYVIYELRNK